jgi:hypothetical protein
MTTNHRPSPLDERLAELVDELMAEPNMQKHDASNAGELNDMLKTAETLKTLGEGYPGLSEGMSKRSIEIKQAYRKSFLEEQRSSIFNMSFSLTTASAAVGVFALMLMVAIVITSGELTGGGIGATASSPTFVITGLVFIVALVSAVAFFFRKK